MFCAPAWVCEGVLVSSVEVAGVDRGGSLDFAGSGGRRWGLSQVWELHLRPGQRGG